MANELYVKSKNVVVYPSALRSGTDNWNNTIRFNPESKLSTEFNVASRINALTDGRNFVIDWNNGTIDWTHFRLCIQGYVFDLDLSNDKTTLLSWNADIYASIQLTDLTSTYSGAGTFEGNYKLCSLTNIKTMSKDQSNLDISSGDPDDADTYTFQGLKISTDVPTGDNIHSIKILTPSGSDLIVPSASYGKFGARDVIFNNNKTLAELIDPATGAVNLAAHLDPNPVVWGQAFDTNNEAKGAMTNVTSISNSATAAVTDGDIGRSDSKFGTVYATKWGTDQIGGWSTGRDSYQAMHLDNGVATGGMTIYSGTSAPASTLGSLGDIYIQYD